MLILVRVGVFVRDGLMRVEMAMLFVQQGHSTQDHQRGGNHESHAYWFLEDHQRQGNSRQGGCAKKGTCPGSTQAAQRIDKARQAEAIAEASQ